MLQPCSKCQVSQYFDNWTKEKCSDVQNVQTVQFTKISTFSIIEPGRSVQMFKMFKQSNVPTFSIIEPGEMVALCDPDYLLQQIISTYVWYRIKHESQRYFPFQSNFELLNRWYSNSWFGYQKPRENSWPGDPKAGVPRWRARHGWCWLGPPCS